MWRRFVRRTIRAAPAVPLPCLPVDDMLSQDRIVLFQLQPLVVVAAVFRSQIEMMALSATHLHELTWTSPGHFCLRFSACGFPSRSRRGQGGMNSTGSGPIRRFLEDETGQMGKERQFAHLRPQQSSPKIIDVSNNDGKFLQLCDGVEECFCSGVAH